MITMYDDGVIKALQGLTTLEEVMRVTNEAWLRWSI
jgi:general secretion pathway protein E